MRKREAVQRWWRMVRRLPETAMPAHTIACPMCAAPLVVPELTQGHEARCPRCRAGLVRVEANPFNGPLAWAFTSLILLGLLSFAPFLGVIYVGNEVMVSLTDMMRDLLDTDYGYLGNLMFLLVFATPFVFLSLTLYVYSALKWGRLWPGLINATRLLLRLRPWMMVDVFFIATVVALTKIRSIGTPLFGEGFFILFVLSVGIVRTALYVPVHWTYYEIFLLENQEITHKNFHRPIACKECLFMQETAPECVVCGADLHPRRPYSLGLSTAFLTAAMILYVPANFLVMMVTMNPTHTYRNTIVGGIRQLWIQEDYAIAIVILIASVLIPFFKMLGLLVLNFSAAVRPIAQPMLLSKLYHVVEWIGRWSMIDVFVIIILMAMFHSPLARVTPGPAVVYFTLVVFLTMLSAYFFDTRLIWDHAEPAHERTQS